MAEIFFGKNSPASEEGDLPYIVSSKEIDLEKGNLVYFIVRIIKPIIGTGFLSIKVRQSSCKDDGFFDVQNLFLIVGAKSDKQNFTLGFQKKKYLKATKAKIGFVSGGTVNVSISSEEPDFA